MWVLAQTTPTDPFSPAIQYLISFGVLGVGIVLAILGHIDLRPSVARQREQETRDANTALLALLDNKVLPVLTTSGEALHAAQTELVEVRKELTELRITLRERGT